MQRLYACEFSEDGRTYRIDVVAKYDKYFSLTADVYEHREGRWQWVSGGCMHDDIAKHFPELGRYVKWHLCDRRGPMHYLANTIYLAGDRDYYGRRAGEPCRWEERVEFESFPVKLAVDYAFAKWLESEQNGREWQEGADYEVIRVDHPREREKFGPKFTFGGAPDEWYQCPFDSEQEALDFLAAMQRYRWRIVKIVTGYSGGKERELDAARRAAVWPDATDDELMADDLRERLEARLPALLDEFNADMSSLFGSEWESDSAGA